MPQKQLSYSTNDYVSIPTLLHPRVFLDQLINTSITVVATHRVATAERSTLESATVLHQVYYTAKSASPSPPHHRARYTTLHRRVCYVLFRYIIDFVTAPSPPHRLVRYSRASHSRVRYSTNCAFRQVCAIVESATYFSATALIPSQHRVRRTAAPPGPLQQSVPQRSLLQHQLRSSIKSVIPPSPAHGPARYVSS